LTIKIGSCLHDARQGSPFAAGPMDGARWPGLVGFERRCGLGVVAKALRSSLLELSTAFAALWVRCMDVDRRTVRKTLVDEQRARTTGGAKSHCIQQLGVATDNVEAE